MKEFVNELLTQQWQDFNLARSLIQQELTGVFGSETMHDLNEILTLYDIYEHGAKFDPEGGAGGDFIPANHKFKIIKELIDKEARFLFSVPPEITLTDSETEGDNSRINPNQKLIKEVLEKNHFYSKLVRAAKDCLIGRRIAIVANFNSSGINVSFVPSLEFIYETDPSDVDIMTKFIQFYSVVVNEEKSSQRIYKKKYEMNEQGYCEITEEVYDGNAQLVETITPTTVTKFKYIPAWVIVNDGLTGDPFGKSDMETLTGSESWYSKLSSKDMDSLRKGTDQIIYAMDVNPRSTKDLSRSAGSFWDLSTDPAAEGKTGQIGQVENNMAYSGALNVTLQRIRASMFSQLDVPDTTSEALTGIISSGKTMRAIYWGLIVRCGEKMLDWKPALVSLINTIIEGSLLYPESRAIYIDEIPVTGYHVEVTNSYPILEDEVEEKGTDMAEINNKVMSRKSYLKKWRGMTDDEAQAELEQIQLEQSMLEDNSMKMDYKEEPTEPEGAEEIEPEEPIEEE